MSGLRCRIELSDTMLLAISHSLALREALMIAMTRYLQIRNITTPPSGTVTV